MSQNNAKDNAYQEDLYIKPGINLQFLAGLMLLGLPLLVLFLLFTRTGDSPTTFDKPIFKPLGGTHQSYLG